jgi:HK97 family phage prohead protease
MTTTIVRKDVLAAITPGEDDETSSTGSFHIILSAPTKDRDGETLLPDEWETPLPEHITMDRDHEMSVAGTVGSGVPTVEDDGALHVRGTYSSLPMAQDVRTLVKEGHIRTTSVAFLRKASTDEKGVRKVQRELLNGAFVAIPANRDALVLSSKAVLKEGRRNSGTDAEKIQAIHDQATGLGATCAMKAAAGTARKDADTEDASDPGALAQGVDAAIDSAIDLLAQVDATTLPEPVQQAIALIQSADATVDELLDALGVPDPDEDTPGTGTASADAAAAKAAAAEADAELAVRALALRAQIALTDTAQKG